MNQPSGDVGCVKEFDGIHAVPVPDGVLLIGDPVPAELGGNPSASSASSA